MEVRLNPDLQAKVDKWTTQTGRSPDELVEDAMAGYLEELTRAQTMVDGRYDDIKSGKVALIDGEEALARLRDKSKARRHPGA